MEVWMICPERTSEHLGTKKLGVLKDGEDFAFLMNMVRRRHLMATSNDPQSLILDRLQPSSNEAFFDDRTPDTDGIVEGGTDVGLKSIQKETQITAPLRSSYRL